MMVLIGREWIPKSWNGVVWEDSDEAEDSEHLNSSKFSLPVETASPLPEEVASPPPSEGIKEHDWKIGDNEILGIGMWIDLSKWAKT